ncbi:MAG: hypothetical protein EZS28_035114 [Streblomastix strix]|uniref:Tyr recombinase domain-containing protein n=1 Tax=Streblomastix strix TaxID=222440 RepID=A0A5J4UH69_9EUKA|nr:MAG: hypothetical protein EZS28_035114 [Streblomastix strix]
MLASWVKFATSNNLDYLNLTIETFIQYLEHLHQESVSSNVIEQARSAISTIFSMGSGIRLSLDERISRIVKGSKKINPQEKKIKVYHDPEPLLLMWERQSISQLDDNTLVARMATMLVLFNSVRFREMSEILQEQTIKNQYSYQILIKTKNDLTNCTRVSISHTATREGVSPLNTLKECLKRRQNKGPLLWKKEGKPLSANEVSNYIKSQIRKTSLPPDCEAYMLKHIGLSKAGRAGVNHDKIREHARWAPGSRMFELNYNLLGEDTEIIDAICAKNKNNKQQEEQDIRWLEEISEEELIEGDTIASKMEQNGSNTRNQLSLKEPTE